MSALAVFDTNVFVSHFLTPNNATAVNMTVERIYDKKVTPVYSDAMMYEYLRVLNRAKFKFSKYKVRSFLKLIQEGGFYVHPCTTVITFTDPSDKCFYEAAVAAGSWLVTGNKRHYPTESFIVSPREYLELAGQ